MDDYGRNMIGPLTINKSSGGYVDARAYGTLGTQAAIVAALADIGADERTLYLAPGTWSITSNLATLANVNLKFERGAVFTIATGTTFTINGSLDAGLYQIFSCTGTGKVVWGLGAVDNVYSEWWGAVADGVTNCSPAIQLAVTSLYSALGHGGTIKFLKGTYLLETTIIITGYNNFTFEGASDGSTVFDVQTTGTFGFTSGNYAMVGDVPVAASNHTYRNLTFQTTGGTPAGAIAFYRVQKAVCDNINMYDSANWNHTPNTVIGIRFVGSDCLGEVKNSLIGGTYTWVGISIEQGSNQVNIHDNSSINGYYASIQAWNNMQVRIYNNNIQNQDTSAGTSYGILLRTDVDCSLSWVINYIGGSYYIYDNLFETYGDNTRYCIYVGSGAVHAAAEAGLSEGILVSYIRGNTFMGNNANFHCIYIDHSDGAVVGDQVMSIDTTTYAGTKKLLEITANAIRTTFDASRWSRPNSIDADYTYRVWYTDLGRLTRMVYDGQIINNIFGVNGKADLPGLGYDGELSTVSTTGSSVDIVSTKWGFKELKVGARITANGETRRVIAINDYPEYATVDAAVDWSAGHNFVYQNPPITIQHGGVTKFIVDSGGLISGYGLSTYTDNAAALAGGLRAGDFYRTSTGVLMITY